MAKGKKKSTTRKAPPAKAEKSSGRKKGAAETGVIQLIPKADLDTLLERCVRFQKGISDTSGEMGKAISEAADKRGLHKGAFGVIKRLKIMGKKDSGKLWLWLTHFDDMRKKAGIDKDAGNQAQMFDAGTTPRTKKSEKPAEEKDATTANGGGEKPEKPARFTEAIRSAGAPLSADVDETMRQKAN